MAGPLVPFWPLPVLGVFLMGFSGFAIPALLSAVVLDLLYGAPLQVAGPFVFPFILLATAAILIRVFVLRYMLGNLPLSL